MLRRTALLKGMATVLATASGCGGTRPDTIVVTGSSTVAPLMAEIAKRYEARNPGLRVDVQTGGSSRGIADVRSGTSNIGMVSRAPTDAENDLQFRTIARDGITVIVHRSNGITSLTRDQVVAIYRGEITDWSAVGGPAGPITVVSKAEGRSTLELFLQYFGLQNSEIRAHTVIGDNEHGIKTVVGNRSAIAYVSIGTAAYDATHGVPIKLVALGEHVPSLQSVRDGAFPLVRPLNLVTLGPIDQRSAALLDFAASDEVDDIVEELHFVPNRG